VGLILFVVPIIAVQCNFFYTRFTKIFMS